MDGLLAILREAIKQVPAMRFALAVVALVAVVAIVLKFNIGTAQTIVGGVVVLIGMVLLFVFSTLTSLDKSALRLPSMVMVWAVLFFVIAGGAVEFWSVFFGPNKINLATLFDSSASVSTSAGAVDTDNAGSAAIEADLASAGYAAAVAKAQNHSEATQKFFQGQGPLPADAGGASQ
ncbi:hypothetical protein SAMN02787142_7801 [Burkholderia sp. WP9]|uniref:hypothetical protein n=1 Tax=Burkholderia sp. WP9 TaxID=1500263 RepID=UPI000897335C|nr:hypothetical protein [Burkholderia sp. WP9]SEF11942.1 hypothetical protein SAMN02787142_7801 [Burkholderia sp. WP9]